MTRYPSIVMIVVSVVLVLPPGLLRAQSAPVDAQTLVGSWVGTWTETGSRRLSGKYVLTIEKVQGDRVSGSGEIIGRRVPVPPFRVNGTLSGNRLTYGSRVRTELAVEGDRMTGNTSGANDDISVVLMKEK